MQSISSRIWTRVAVSISYDDNHYTTGTSYRIILRQSEFNNYGLQLHTIQKFINIFLNR